MKRFHYFLIVGFALALTASVGYSDSHEIKKDTVQVYPEFETIGLINSIDYSSIELPAALIVDAPDLGRPATQHFEVSEELTDVFEMRIRPPPEKVQKSEYKNSNLV